MKEWKMKFKISRPPTEGDDLRERLDKLTGWLYSLSDSLNVTLENLGEDNFNKSFLNNLKQGKENSGDNT